MIKLNTPITILFIFFGFIISIICLKVIKDFYYNYITMSKPIIAIAVFSGPTIKGTVKFTEDIETKQVQIDVNLVGLKKSALHGFHVHESGDLSDKGNAQYTFYDDVIRLRGTKANILGRGLIIHADPDDCGSGGYPDSLTTGHAGKRIACAIIGYSKDNFK
jgi:Cu-Zn family superoxide dismutase